MSRRRAGPWRRYLRRYPLFRRAETQYRYLRSRKVLLRWGLMAFGALVLLTVLWVLVTGLVARNDAVTIRSRLAQVQHLVAAGDVSDAQKVAATIPGLAQRAHRLTTGPAWFLASEVPYFGKPLKVVRGTADATDVLGSQGVTSLLSVIGQLDPTKLRVRGDTVNLAPIIAAAPDLARVDVALQRALTELQGVPSSTWLPPIDSVRANLVSTLTAVSGYVDAASRAAQVLPTLLGNTTPKRYFIGLQNEAEMRGTGGLPGSFAILEASKGRIRFTHFESDAALMPGATHLINTGLDFGPEFDQLYSSAQPTTRYVDSNISPNFPYAAQIWSVMWEKVSGEHIDGAIALDPQVLANLLQATGPLKTVGGGVLTSSNVVPLTEQQEYAIFTNDAERKQFLVDVLKDVSKYAIGGRASAVGLVQALSTSAKEHRVLFWTSDAAEQKLIDQTNYSGAIPQGNGQGFAGLVVTNAAAGKLDYYLRRSFNYQSTGCGPTRDVVVKIELTNTAPASGLPAYVTTRLDHDPPADVKPGDNREIVDYWATPGAQLASVTINGTLATAAVYQQLGHPMYRFDVELPLGTTSTLVLNLVEPRLGNSPVIWQQPGVVPMDVTTEMQHC